MDTSLASLLDHLRQFRDARDWSQFHTPKDLAISVSVEAAELLEIFQWRPQIEISDLDLRSKVGAEAADVLLYLLLLCDRLGIDLLVEADRKLRLNERRFPIETSRGVAKPKDQFQE
ncbi:nucleotide pyrophosphohydrolase [Rhizobium ruizarguesonis]|uniref:nucleotide pyrophosphohydrolase n=1 Tax=Rhizobium ruizarguesonis TaxID=2081791 RepID=UPI001030A245|nr:nucleotide pyrophosphohydrolase [Rhizobium ruizarguesonis]TBD65710.1 nucleotide pyrophosphohydrolase [Rhizobium ruizarguesonis]